MGDIEREVLGWARSRAESYSSIRKIERQHTFLPRVASSLCWNVLYELGAAVHPRRPRMRAHKPHPPTPSVPLFSRPHGVVTLRAHRRPECTGQHPQIEPQMERRAGKRGDVLQRAVHGPRIANLSTFSLDRVEASDNSPEATCHGRIVACRRSRLNNLSLTLVKVARAPVTAAKSSAFRSASAAQPVVACTDIARESIISHLHVRHDEMLSFVWFFALRSGVRHTETLPLKHDRERLRPKGSQSAPSATILTAAPMAGVPWPSRSRHLG